MDYRCKEPDPETRTQNTGQGYVFIEAEQCNEEKEDAGQNTPERSFREGLHDFGIAFILQIDPEQDQGAGQRHDGNQAGGGWELLGDGSSNEDDHDAEYDFD